MLEHEEEDIPVIPTILDFFRFRPGVTSSSFATAQRILSSGGPSISVGTRRGGRELDQWLRGAGHDRSRTF